MPTGDVPTVDVPTGDVPTGDVPTGDVPTGDVPTVDVMVPAYGDGPLLREAIDSVLAQDTPRWRLSIFDDGGDSPQLVRYVAAQAERLGGDRVRYERNPRTLGINRNFQRCVDEADADLVILLGADDRLLPGYVRTVATAAARHPQAAWLQPGVRIIDGTGAPVMPLADRIKGVLRPTAARSRLLGGEELVASLLRGNWMYFPSVAFRREVIQKYGFRRGYDVVLDLDLYVRMLFDGHQALSIDHLCFEYRRHAASLSSTEAVSGARFDEELRYFSEVRAQAQRRGWNRASRAASLHLTSRLHALALAPTALRARDRRLLTRMLRQAFGGTRLS